MKQYIDSQEHWEDSVNADYDRREAESKAMQPTEEQPNPLPQVTESEDELWASVGRITTGLASFVYYPKVLEQLKQSYTIKRNQ